MKISHAVHALMERPQVDKTVLNALMLLLVQIANQMILLSVRAAMKDII